MGVIDRKAKSGEIKPNLWWRYRDDIFDLWTQGQLNDFTWFITSLYPTSKFTVVSSETSLNVLDLTLNLVDGFIHTDIYTKPTDNHIYLLRNNAHPAYCTKASHMVLLLGSGETVPLPKRLENVAGNIKNI